MQSDQNKRTNERVNERHRSWHITLHCILSHRIANCLLSKRIIFLVSHVAASRHNYSNPVAKLKWMECKWTILMRSCRNDWKRCSFQAVQISTSDISVEQIENALNICLILKVQSWYADASKWFSAVKRVPFTAPIQGESMNFNHRIDSICMYHWYIEIDLVKNNEKRL